MNRCIIILWLIVLCCFVVPAFAEDTPRTPTTDPTVINDMLTRMNTLRQRLRLPAYRLNDALNRAAQDQAQWLVDTGIRGHFRPDGSRPSTRAAAQGYTAEWCCGENYYMSIDATPDMVWNFWVWSYDHYVNLTHPRFDEVGVGYAVRGVRISYVLVFGDSLNGAPPPPPAPEPTAAPAPTAAAPSVVSSSGGIYTVQRGDTLVSIARAHGITLDALVSANAIVDPSRIMVGQQLTIPGSGTAVVANAPAPAAIPVVVVAETVPVNTTTVVQTVQAAPGGTHTVSSGETLFRIAQRYGVSVAALMSANQLTDSTIYVGQSLTIPSGGTPAVWYGAAPNPASVPSPIAGVTATITSPIDGQVLTGPQAIIGTVQFTSDQAQGYHFFIRGGAFEGWTPLGVEHTTGVVAGELETLYTPALQSGTYRLRLMLRINGDLRTAAEIGFNVP